MSTIEKISNSPVYKEVLRDSFGGVLYNVANRDKYDDREILALWAAMPAPEKEAAGGIMQGAFNFLQGN